MLIGDLIHLRFFEARDLEPLYALHNDLSQRPLYLGSRLRPLHIDRKQFEEDGFWGKDKGSMLITSPHDERLGFISFFGADFYHTGCEIGYSLFRTSDWNKGYTTDAVKLFTAYLFDNYPFERIQMTISPHNPGSLRVAEKCGFQREGLLRRYLFFRGQYQDMYLYSMLRGEHTPNTFQAPQREPH